MLAKQANLEIVRQLRDGRKSYARIAEELYSEDGKKAEEIRGCAHG